MSPAECINRGTHWGSFILILSIKQTTPTLNNQLYWTAVSACTHWRTRHYCMFHWLQIPQLIHLHLQGKFFLSPHRFPSIFRLARSMRKHLLVSDGSSQLRVHPCDAEGSGYHPAKYPLLPGWDQSRGHPFLSHTVYSPHAAYLSQQPTHSPLWGHIRAPQSNMPPSWAGQRPFYLCSRQTASTRELSTFTWDSWSAESIPTYTAPARSTTSSRT